MMVYLIVNHNTHLRFGEGVSRRSQADSALLAACKVSDEEAQGMTNHKHIARLLAED